MSYKKHESAVIDTGATIGDDTRIWHFTHVMPGAKIGRGCNIGQNCFIDPEGVIGDYCKLQNNVSIYSAVTLEDYVFCGPSCVFTNVVNPRCEIDRKNEFKPTLVKRGASIGANATIVCGTTIGRYAFIGAGAVVTKDVYDYALMVGSPARQVGWMTRHGDILKFDDFTIESEKIPGHYSVAKCKLSGWRYELLWGGSSPLLCVSPGTLKNDPMKLHLVCLDHGEDEPL